MQELIEKIERMDATQVGDAVKNLRISLQYNWKLDISDEEAKLSFEEVKADDKAEWLRKEIVYNAEDSEAMHRYGRGLLKYCTADLQLRPFVEEAVKDALNSGVKDFGLTALITLGVVIVLLKYRPKEIKSDKNGIKIKWDDNDVSVISDLTNLISPFSKNEEKK